MDRDQRLVQRTATLLDLHDPGWYERISTRRLDLTDDYQCVLGQAYGKFGNEEAQHARRFMFLVPKDPFYYIVTALAFVVSRGKIRGVVPAPFFSLSKRRTDKLTLLWAEEIQRRQLAPPFDGRARFLAKREWILPVIETQKEVAAQK